MASLQRQLLIENVESCYKFNIECRQYELFQYFFEISYTSATLRCVEQQARYVSNRCNCAVQFCSKPDFSLPEMPEMIFCLFAKRTDWDQ